MKSNEKANTKREALFEAALMEFSQKSYDDASLNAILDNAMVSKGAFYYSFSDKLDLYRQLLYRSGEQKMQYMSTKSAKASDNAASNSIFEQLHALSLDGLEFFHEYPMYYRFSIMFTKETEEFRKAITNNSNIEKEYMTKMIKGAIASGDIDSKYPVEFATQIFGYIMTHFVDIVGFEDSSVDEAVESLNLFYYFVENGLGKGESK